MYAMGFFCLFFSASDRFSRHFVAADIIERALQTCEQFLSVLDHCDIDMSVEESPTALELQWAEFLHNYYMVVQWVCKCASLHFSHVNFSAAF